MPMSAQLALCQVLAPSWIGLLELDCKLQSGFSLDILSLVLDFLVRHFDLGLGFSFLFCRALTLNLDLYFFSFFSYPGGEQHCFD
ncbi:hypothetical protein RhiirA4_470461 [Rhizophagus irregularis]|uniref:Uncharacterized protein n=1 Tax=Rhizophagus irregularis TaxID=588596 RepID=A0A2I1H1G0_9GLOM|nr:hypothetical protein RhiirA4_470461 [Rhizophagus irregularis]